MCVCVCVCVCVCMEDYLDKWNKRMLIDFI